MSFGVYEWLKNYISIHRIISRSEHFFCLKYTDSLSLLTNLKVLYIHSLESNDQFKSLAEACPLLEVFECADGVTDVGLEHLCSLQKLKCVYVGRMKNRNRTLGGRLKNVLMNRSLTPFGIASFLKNCRNRIQRLKELHSHDRVMVDAVNSLSFENHVIPSLKHLECRDTDFMTPILPVALTVFPSVECLYWHLGEGENFQNRLEMIIKFRKMFHVNMTVTHLKVIVFESCYMNQNEINEMLQFINIVFPKVISLEFVVRSDGSKSNIESSLIFPLIQNLYFRSTFAMSAFLFPGNCIKVFHIYNHKLFTNRRYNKYVKNLTEVEEINYSRYEVLSVDTAKDIIDNIIKFLPCLRVFKFRCLITKYNVVRLLFLLRNTSRINFIIDTCPPKLGRWDILNKYMFL